MIIINKHALDEGDLKGKWVKIRDLAYVVPRFWIVKVSNAKFKYCDCDSLCSLCSRVSIESNKWRDETVIESYYKPFNNYNRYFDCNPDQISLITDPDATYYDME